MSKGWQGALLRGLGAKEHLVRVTGKRSLTSNMLRVECHSETLLDTNGEAPACWVRGWFPDPEGRSRLFQRGYTLVDPDPSSGSFSIDFVIHHPTGPAAHWASECEIGDEIAVMRYGEHPFEMPDPAPRGCLFLGDLASLPAIRSLVESLPAQMPVVVLMEKHSPEDEGMPLPQGPNVVANWVDELPDGQALVQALAGQDWTGWYAWVTAESTATRHARTALQREHVLTKATLHAQAYWVRGRAMGTSQDVEAATIERPRSEPEELLEPRTDTAAPSVLSTSALSTAGAAPVPTAQSTSASSHSAPVLGVLAPVKGPLIAAGVAQALISLLQIVPFILFAEVAKLFLDGADRDAYWRTATQAAFVLGVSALASALLVLALHAYDATFGAQVRRRLTEKLTSLPLGWFRQRSATEVKKLVSDDVSALHALVTHAVPDIVGAVVTLLSVLVYLFAVQWRLALVLLVPVVAYIVVMVGVQRQDSAKVLQAQRDSAEVAGQAQEFLATRDAAALYGAGAVVDLPGTLTRVGDFTEQWQRQTGPRKIAAVMLNRPTTLLGLIVLAGYVFVVAGWVAPADLVPFLVLGTSFGAQLLAVGFSVAALAVGLDARAGLDLFLATPPLQQPPARAAEPEHVRFDRVSFSYTPQHQAIRELSLTLQPGEVTALVGPSGAGKSTVAALLARLWDVDAGAISIDGRDVRDLGQKELYARVGVLLQDVQLIEASVADNISLAAPDAPRERIEEVARAAAIHDTIMTLPQGYDTVVTARRLSGGERQRIGIARALLADTPIIVLDEASSAADPESEWLMQQGLARLLAGRTVLMIAHRLHTVRGADRIVVMDEGRIVESGSHDHLVQAQGLYSRLWSAHSRAGALTSADNDRDASAVHASAGSSDVREGL